ncbi:MAG: carboxynorspermidine decarboxylase [archaeon]|jgi:carboxynorspermidine decarboxylase
MEASGFQRINIEKVSTPCYIVSGDALVENLKILRMVKQRTGCKILLATKAFSMYSTFPLIRKYLDGTCASSLNEARLGYEEFKGEVHTFAPAFSESDFKQITKYSDHIVFNSMNQWNKYKSKIVKSRNLKRKKIEAGIRINPEFSEVKVDMYNPCAPFSRMGMTVDKLEGVDLSGISGIHFHAMCQQNSDTLKHILEVVDEKFGKYIKQMKWVNFGGGHHITRKDYDVDLLCELIINFKKKYGVEVYLEPGEAVALNTGILVATVLDIIDNKKKIAVLDTSAETHMPDVLAMPYTPMIIGAGEEGKFKYDYRLAGVTCLAGDVIGDYSFPEELKIGQKLVFLDMAIYSMVKNTTFNGINLPSIVLYKNGKLKIIKKFGYSDFKRRV